MNQNLIPKSSKLYFTEMYKYKILQMLEKDSNDVHDQLLSNDAHCHDEYYAEYLKNQYLAIGDMMRYISKAGFK